MLSRTINRENIVLQGRNWIMGIPDFFASLRKKHDSPVTEKKDEDLFEPVTRTEPPTAPGQTVPVPKITDFSLPDLFEPETEPKSPTASVPSATVLPPDAPPEAPTQKTAPPVKTPSILQRAGSLFKKKGKKSIEEYTFLKHGPLVVGELLADHTLIDQYWIDEGQSLVYITLNNKTNQMEYLLFEPVLSNFEYELLERLHEDLRDVLILSTDEIKKDRKLILLDKAMGLLDDYGVTLETQSLFKI
jgi:hypothetical protein